MKLWERITEQKRHETNVSKNQLGFTLERSMMEVIDDLTRVFDN